MSVVILNIVIRVTKNRLKKEELLFFFEITLIYYYLCTADQSYDGCLYTRLLS